MNKPQSADDATTMAVRYARRGELARYSLLRPEVWQSVQERQRAVLRLLARLGWHDLPARRMLEVGCGAGGNLLEFLRMGFLPEHLMGIELLSERYAHARAVLPAVLQVLQGDASRISLPAEHFDIAFQSTVFSSLLDDATQARLAQAMWHCVKPGGGVLWYDFAVDNPRNPDVRGMPVAHVQALFPLARVQVQRVTLAPPLARAVCSVHPGLYHLFNAVSWLRTHRLVWLQK